MPRRRRRAPLSSWQPGTRSGVKLSAGLRADKGPFRPQRPDPPSRRHRKPRAGRATFPPDRSAGPRAQDRPSAPPPGTGPAAGRGWRHREEPRSPPAPAPRRAALSPLPAPTPAPYSRYLGHGRGAAPARGHAPARPAPALPRELRWARRGLTPRPSARLRAARRLHAARGWGRGVGSPAREVVEKGGEGKVRVQPLFCPPRKYIPPRCRQALSGEERSGLRLGVGSEGRALRGQRGPSPAACAGGGRPAWRVVPVAPHRAVRVRGTGKAPPGAARYQERPCPRCPPLPLVAAAIALFGGVRLALLLPGRWSFCRRGGGSPSPAAPGLEVRLSPCFARILRPKWMGGTGGGSESLRVPRVKWNCPRPVAPACWYSARAHVLLRFLKDSSFWGQNVREV